MTNPSSISGWPTDDERPSGQPALVNQAPAGLGPAGFDRAQVGPRPDVYHRRELPGKPWLTCSGCPAFRTHDWHYLYCRHLGDIAKPDEWMGGGWSRLGGMTWNADRPAPCGLPEIHAPTPEQSA